MKKFVLLLICFSLLLMTACSLLPEDKASLESSKIEEVSEEMKSESQNKESQRESVESIELKEDSKSSSEQEKEIAQHSSSKEDGDKNTELSDQKLAENQTSVEDKKKNEESESKRDMKDVKLPEGYQLSEEKTEYVALIMDSGNQIVIQLRPDVAPISSENFQNLVAEEFYTGIIFHRVIKDFMIQGGDPTGTGAGGSSKTIKGEFAANGVKNSLSHNRGVVSMARRGNDMDSASSQFFICHADVPYLDGEYASFGEVVFGMEEVDRIAELQVDATDKPLEAPVIEQAVFVTPIV